MDSETSTYETDPTLLYQSLVQIEQGYLPPLRTVLDLNWSNAVAGACLIERMFHLTEYACMEQLSSCTSIRSMLIDLHTKGLTLDRLKYDPIRSLPIQMVLRIDGYEHYSSYTDQVGKKEQWIKDQFAKRPHGMLLIRLPVYHSQAQFWIPTSMYSHCLGYHTVIGVGYDEHVKGIWIQNHWGNQWDVRGYSMLELNELSHAIELWSVWSNVEERMKSVTDLRSSPEDSSAIRSMNAALTANPLQVLLSLAESWKQEYEAAQSSTIYQYILLAIILFTMIIFSWVIQRDKSLYLNVYSQHMKQTESELSNS